MKRFIFHQYANHQLSRGWPAKAQGDTNKKYGNPPFRFQYFCLFKNYQGPQIVPGPCHLAGHEMKDYAILSQSKTPSLI